MVALAEGDSLLIVEVGCRLAAKGARITQQVKAPYGLGYSAD